MLHVPNKILQCLNEGFDLAISISGGKDGQAMLKLLSEYHSKEKFKGKIFAIHADLGEVEWKESISQCQRTCEELGIELVVVKRENGGLLERWQERMDKLQGTGKPFWSSAKNRYCTSDLKRGPINKYLRKFNRIISAEGIRAEESKARAEKLVYEQRSAICTKSRDAYTWNPVIGLKKEDVWGTYGHSSSDLETRRQLYKKGLKIEALEGWKFHPAYVYGNERVSCMLCILGSKNDLKNGAVHNPDLLNKLIEMEDKSGFTFRHNMSLRDLI